MVRRMAAGNAGPITFTGACTYVAGTGESGVGLGLARIAAIPMLIRLRNVKKKQNHAAAYAIAIVRLPR